MPARPFHADAAVSIWQADALALPIPDGSVDLVVTSPPYFALRSRALEVRKPPPVPAGSDALFDLEGA